MANKFRTNPNRQELVVAEVKFDADSINESGVVTMFQPPQGAVVVWGHLVPDGNYDATSGTMSLGDASDAERYLAATDIKVAAETALDTDGIVVGENNDIIATFAIVGAATTGGGRVAIHYYEVGRGGPFLHGAVVETP